LVSIFETTKFPVPVRLKDFPTTTFLEYMAEEINALINPCENTVDITEDANVVEDLDRYLPFIADNEEVDVFA
jgi:hypothetical protein